MRHGTSSGYRYHGCRCPECTAVATAQTARARVARRLKAGPTESQAAAMRGLPGEEWRTVTGHEDYEVSNLGRLRSNKFTFPEIMSTVRNRDGYVKVRMWRENRSYFRYLHVLVTTAFHGPRAPGLEVRHLDDDKLNNRADNLTWGTRSENIRDMVRNGKQHQRSKTHCPQGHPYDEANTYVRPQGWRSCRTCQRERSAA